MSIIHEALKKTQEMKTGTESALDKKPEINSPPIQPSKAKVHQASSHAKRIRKSSSQTEASVEVFSESPVFWRALGVTSLLGLFLVGMVGVSSMFHFQAHLKVPTTFFSKKAGAGPQYAGNAVKSLMPAPAYWVLNGIMLEGQHRVAVINDQIYQVGDQIEDKKITDIAFDHVSLQNAQNRFELKTRV